MNRTKIEYLTHTWNPIAMRCTPVSQGCDNCWHLAVCKRHAANPTLPPEVRAARAGGPPVLLANVLAAPLRRREPSVVGVQFMGDLFHEDVPFPFIDKVFAAMALTPQHTYQLLTKRPERMAEYLDDDRSGCKGCILDAAGELSGEAIRMGAWPLENLWLGVTTENQKTLDERWPILAQTPAAVRFVSLEPLLSPVDVSRYLRARGGGTFPISLPRRPAHATAWTMPGLDWVVLGGETGPGARPMAPKWVRDVRDQCQAASVPFFFKGWGDWAPLQDHPGFRHKRDFSNVGYFDDLGDFTHGVSGGGWQHMVRVGKKAAGRVLDGRTWDEYPKTGVRQ